MLGLKGYGTQFVIFALRNALRQMLQRFQAVDYVTFKGDGHGNMRWNNNLTMYRKTEDFLAQCIGGRSSGFDYYQLATWAF